MPIELGVMLLIAAATIGGWVLGFIMGRWAERADAVWDARKRERERECNQCHDEDE